MNSFSKGQAINEADEDLRDSNSGSNPCIGRLCHCPIQAIPISMQMPRLKVSHKGVPAIMFGLVKSSHPHGAGNNLYSLISFKIQAVNIYSSSSNSGLERVAPLAPNSPDSDAIRSDLDWMAAAEHVVDARALTP